MAGNQSEDARAVQQVPLTMAALADDDGKTAEDHFVERMTEIEDHITQFRKTHYDQVPEKEYAITLTVKVRATSRAAREVVWELTDVKKPKLAVSHTQHATARDGLILTEDALQHKLDLSIPPQ